VERVQFNFQNNFLLASYTENNVLQLRYNKAAVEITYCMYVSDTTAIRLKIARFPAPFYANDFLHQK
jgi:hypothetical protein